MKMYVKVIAAVVVLLGGGTFYKFTSQVGPMTGMDHSKMTLGAASDATKGYETAMAAMMKGMMQPVTGKADLDFASGMIPHHQGAVDMAEVVLQFGKDAEIKKLAEDVVKAQVGEIAFMKKWLAKTDQNTLPVLPDSMKANEAAMAVMMKNMMVAATGNPDLDFVKGMIPHHQGAIDMAKVALQYAKDPALLKLATDIVSAQDRETVFMKDWLKRNGH
jgi:uncharacterized protein (DUF305 family)